MEVNNLSVKIGLEEPIIVNKNTVKVGVLMNGKKSTDITLVHNGQEWQVER